MNAKKVKQAAGALGADLCGIAPVERFGNAPPGFHPEDIFPGTRSVVVLAKRFPEGVFASGNPVPYTEACDLYVDEVFRMACRLLLDLQDHGVKAVPVPSEPYLYWDAEALEGRGILSLKHAGVLAGLGAMGRNTLLINRRFGNRITLGALLVDEPLDGDPVVSESPCADECKLCMEQCPVKAIEEGHVVQMKCRRHSVLKTEKGCELYACRACREICPNGKGFSNKKP